MPLNTLAHAKEQTLPRSPFLLNQLLTEINAHLQFLRRFLHRQETRVAGIPSLKKSGPELVHWQDLLAEIHKELMRELATAPPEPERLARFLNPAHLQTISAQHEASLRHKEGSVTTLEATLAGARQMVALLEELRLRVVTRLECDKRDKSCDKSAPKTQLVPRNPQALKLAHALNSRTTPKRPKLEVAREFTGGNVQEAKSLLRTLNRYPELVTR